MYRGSALTSWEVDIYFGRRRITEPAYNETREDFSVSRPTDEHHTTDRRDLEFHSSVVRRKPKRMYAMMSACSCAERSQPGLPVGATVM